MSLIHSGLYNSSLRITQPNVIMTFYSELTHNTRTPWTDGFRTCLHFALEVSILFGLTLLIASWYGRTVCWVHILIWQVGLWINRLYVVTSSVIGCSNNYIIRSNGHSVGEIFFYDWKNAWQTLFFFLFSPFNRHVLYWYKAGMAEFLQ